MKNVSPGTLIGTYTILAPLGHGGMGVVYRAHDARLDRDVALKILPPEIARDPGRRGRFEREARLLAALNHPNIVTIHSVEEVDGTLFLTMELVDGAPLSEVIPPGGFEIPRMLGLAIPLADALASAHDRGVVHRDLKPANVVVTADGRPKVLDFGLAKSNRAQSADDAATMSLETPRTEAGMILGTLPYMSPEQVQGMQVDHRSDIFSLGVLLYELGTGRRPFDGPNPASLLSAILRDTPLSMQAINRHAPSGLVGIVDRCLEKRPAARYQSARDVRRDLEELAKGVDRDTTSPKRSVESASRAPGLRRGARRGVWAAAVLLLVLAAALALDLAVGRGHWPFGATAPAIGSIAVLPLENLAGDAEGEIFSDGVTEALITDLAKIRALRVVSRTSVMRYRKTRKAIPEIAREMNVDAVVAGSVERVAGRVRVNAELISGAADRHLWAESYDRELRDVLALQDELARTIARAVQVTVTPEEAARLGTTRRVDPEAYSLYAKGRYFWNKRTAESVDKATEYFRRALDKDPTYAAAWAGLADSYASLGFSFDVGRLAPREAWTKAKEAALRALALDDTLADAHNSLGFIELNYDWDWAAAESEFKRALTLNPGDAAAHHWYAHYLVSIGRLQAALEESKKALDLDLLNPIINDHLGWYYFYAREYDKAVQQLHKALEMDDGDGVAHWYLGLAYEGQRKYGEAIDEMKRGVQILKGEVVATADLGHAYAVAGRVADARAIIAQLENLSRQRYVSPYNVALIHIGLGERVKGFESLDRAFDDRSELLIYLRIDPRLDTIRGDSRFEQLVARVGIPSPAVSDRTDGR